MREGLDERVREEPDDRLRDEPDDRLFEEPLDDFATAGATTRTVASPKTIKPRVNRRPAVTFVLWGSGTDMVFSLYVPGMTSPHPLELHRANRVPAVRKLSTQDRLRNHNLFYTRWLRMGKHRMTEWP
ncbi:hypothetical protein ACFL5Q_05820 [Planctomycetota bacterium]